MLCSGNIIYCLSIMLGMSQALAVSLHVSFSKSSRYSSCFPLNYFLTAPIFLEWEWWEMSYSFIEALHGKDDFEFLLLLVTWGHSLSYYLPGTLLLWVFSSSLDFWGIMPKHSNFHFLRLNSNFIYYLSFYAQRRLFCICTIQQGMFLVTEHLSFESLPKRYPNVQQVSLTKEKFSFRNCC